MSEGFVKSEIQNKIAEVTFYHPKSNSLPLGLLNEMISIFENLSNNSEANVILLKSKGEKTFCAGASFDELLEIKDFEGGKRFFMGFARLINAMRKCSKIIVGRVQGKVVGGGVGLVAACDYSFGTINAALRLSELAIGLGPFVVGPPIERKIGKEAFIEMSLDCEWRSPEWAKEKGFYHDICNSVLELDDAVENFAKELSERNPDALRRIKHIYWEGTEHWDKLLEERAEYSGELVLSDHTKNFIQKFKSNS
ncbi:MAG: enoyl-CoA hydratase/isomerase family protein [Melioribacteraceae bacterium]|nr:enoyl-CoA hydratase/isomerase family protein [Melioribacteraceae bacterium]